MGIIPYQAFFFFSVMLMFALGRHLRASGVSWWAWVPRAWVTFCVIFTMANVFMLELMIFQLGVIIAATIWSSNLMREADTKRRLQATIEQVRQELSAEQAKLLERIPRHAFKLISGREHERVLDEAIAEARRTLCITSGWINQNAMNKKRVRGIREALDRGVHVVLVFGWRDFRKEETLDQRAQRIVETLYKLSLKTNAREDGGKLILAHVPVHSKLLVRDDTLAVVGSNNWMSNSTFKNHEHSTLIEDAAFARTIRADALEMARQGDANTIPRLLAKAKAEAAGERRGNAWAATD